MQLSAKPVWAMRAWGIIPSSPFLSVGRTCPVVCMLEEFLRMPQYVLKILLDFEARDDLDARQAATRAVEQLGPLAKQARELVLHSQADRKSIRLNPDGTFSGQWNKGGPSSPPGVKP